MNAARFETASAEETQALGRRLGALAEPGDLYLLRGPLGAGKTTLLRDPPSGVLKFTCSPPSAEAGPRHGRASLPAPRSPSSPPRANASR